MNWVASVQVPESDEVLDVMQCECCGNQDVY